MWLKLDTFFNQRDSLLSRGFWKWDFQSTHKPLFISLRWLQKNPMTLSKFLLFKTTCLLNALCGEFYTNVMLTSRDVRCTEKFNAPRFIPFESMHRLQIPDFDSIRSRFYIHQNSQYGVHVKCRQREFLCNGYLNHYGDVNTHLFHSGINRIWPAISAQFFIIVHTKLLCQNLVSLTSYNYDVLQMICRRDSSWEKSFVRLKRYNRDN
jgi:hypothetical protein